MDFSSLFGTSRVTGQLAQYPDKNLYKAATLLGAEERPTVPVRLYDDAEKLYQEELQPRGGARISSNAIAVTPRTKDNIFVRRGTMEYNSPEILASKLAHEQVHIGQPEGPGDELPAYEKEASVIGRYPKAVTPEYLARMNEYIQRLRMNRK